MRSIAALYAAILLSVSAIAQTSTSNKDNNTKPFVLGVIDELYSKELGEKRILNIYLPEGYVAGGNQKYPVTYLLDGSADEDFIHVAGLYQYNSFEWINRAPKSIVVGIATVDRRRDFTYPTTIEEDKKKYPTSGQSAKFMAFIEKELLPYIENKYNASTDKTLMGQSLGGLLATEMLLKKTRLFNRYIIVSPSLWWDNGSLLNQSSELLSSSYPKPTSVYIAVGKEGLTPTAIPRVMEVDANLLAEKLQQGKSKNLRVTFDYLPQENHATIYHQAILNAIKVIYTKAE